MNNYAETELREGTLFSKKYNDYYSDVTRPAAAHSSATLTLKFEANLNQGNTDESYGVTNIQVQPCWYGESY